MNCVVKKYVGQTAAGTQIYKQKVLVKVCRIFEKISHRQQPKNCLSNTAKKTRQ